MAPSVQCVVTWRDGSGRYPDRVIFSLAAVCLMRGRTCLNVRKKGADHVILPGGKIELGRPRWRPPFARPEKKPVWFLIRTTSSTSAPLTPPQLTMTLTASGVWSTCATGVRSGLSPSQTPRSSSTSGLTSTTAMTTCVRPRCCVTGLSRLYSSRACCKPHSVTTRALGLLTPQLVRRPA